jgi:hypothetical protein
MLPSRIVISVPAHSTARDVQREYGRGDVTGVGDGLFSMTADMATPFLKLTLVHDL